MRQSVLVLLALAFVATAADAQSRRAENDRMPRSMLGRIQEFLKEKAGAELAVLDPSVAALVDIDADNKFQREALGMLAEKLGDKDRFNADAEDPDKARQVALKIVQANRDPENLAFVSSMISERLSELEAMGKKERQEAAAELAPLLKYARPIRDLAAIVERAGEMAEKLKLAEAMGTEEEGVVVDESDSSLVWRPILSIGRMGQLGTGKLEVAFKSGKLGALGKKKLQAYLVEHPIPVFPGKRGYRVFKHAESLKKADLPMDDHHHLLDTLHSMGVAQVPTREFSLSSGDASESDRHVYLYDQWGVKRSVDDLPRNVRGLGDFPYRSVAWMVREFGGFKKHPIPYLEMHVADFFRRNTKTHPNVDFYEAVREALDLSKTRKFKDWFARFLETHR